MSKQNAREDAKGESKKGIVQPERKRSSKTHQHRATETRMVPDVSSNRKKRGSFSLSAKRNSKAYQHRTTEKRESSSQSAKRSIKAHQHRATA